MQDEQLNVLIGVGLISAGVGVFLQHFKMVTSMRVFLIAVIGLLSATFCVSQWHLRAEESRVAKEVEQLFRNRSFVGYDPTTIDVFTNPKTPCDLRQSEEELGRLRDHFDAIYTFGSDLNQDQLAEIAVSRLDYKAFIMGIFINGVPTEDEEQVRLAIAAREHVTAYCVGHNADVELDVLAKWIAKVRRDTKRPVGTTYPPLRYIGQRGKSLQQMGDFYFPDVSPRSLRTNPSVNEAIVSLQKSIDVLADLESEKPVLLKMIGYPSGPSTDGFSEENQAEFFRRVRRGDITLLDHTYVTYFSAFDSPGKLAQPTSEWASTEGRLGLFTVDGSPKKVIKDLVFEPFDLKQKSH